MLRQFYEVSWKIGKTGKRRLDEFQTEAEAIDYAQKVVSKYKKASAYVSSARQIAEGSSIFSMKIIHTFNVN